MSWYLLFYLFSILEKLQYLFIWGAIIGTVGYIAFSIVHFMQKYQMIDNQHQPDGVSFKESEKWVKSARAPRITFFVISLLSFMLIVFTPNRKDLILIIAGGAVGEFVMNDDNAKKLPADITRFLRGEILKATAELTDEAKASIGIKTKLDTLKSMSKEQLIEMLNEKDKKK